jgi:hypothetical protein
MAISEHPKVCSIFHFPVLPFFILARNHINRGRDVGGQINVYVLVALCSKEASVTPAYLVGLHS